MGTSLTRTMGLLRYSQTVEDIKLQNLMYKHFNDIKCSTDNCTSFYFKIGFENNPHGNIECNFSSQHLPNIPNKSSNFKRVNCDSVTTSHQTEKFNVSELF